MKTKSTTPFAAQQIRFLGLLLCATMPALAQTFALRLNGRIAFTSDRDGNREIYVMNGDGTNDPSIQSD
jgi:hypothetical protein